MITINHLKKQYPNATPLKDVNVTINKGDVISVIGPSGTGKSTLLRCINMLDIPTSGEIIVDGEDITKKGYKLNEVRKKMGMVFQSFNLFEHITVIENIMKPPMDILGMSKPDAYQKGMELLRRVGLADKALNYPEQLSGGQKQRVAIARTLAMDPEIILFDEPTSALDPTMVGEVEVVIRNLAEEGKTMMLVTHDMNFAKQISNRVFYMDQGGIYDDGTPEEIFDNPKKELTRRFIKQLKALDISISSKDFDFIGVMSEISTYAYKNQMNPKNVYRIQSVFEELCIQIIMPSLPDEFAIKVSIEYDEKSNDTFVTVMYDGEQKDCTLNADELSLAVIKGFAKELKYEAIEKDGFTNRISMIIK